ncbi:hypothetical protein DFO70_10988 [Cytobacillus firmus]|uniref:Uncharacterized protein n=2 Tax=Cytobacillus TaxID=2675230 RepID=A0A366JQN5_CYTFI|nr:MULTISPECIES: hypothetical protein [Cytobacillus]RBP90582.1 hypothetical protein DFO70_10988 [Cytobacillus firmus]TDX46164.1 hypothetical protein DFO72_102645 [Cytobacillus oceanisediminis]
MKIIYSLKVMEKTEIQKASQNIKGRQLKIVDTYFFPVLFSVWEVVHKSFFRKEVKSRSITAADLTRGNTGLADLFPDFAEYDTAEYTIIEPSLSPVKQAAECREFIRKYYIHYKRIWTPPVIELVKEEVVHQPYTILVDPNASSARKKYYLLEHSSNNLDLLSNYPHIKEICSNVLKGGDDL